MLNKLNVKRYINDETGVSLLIAVMTLLVLSIIGVTLATVTFANVKLTTTDREYQSAYYIAEAGVNETYAEIKELILDSYDNTTNESDFYSAIEPVLLEDISDSALTNFERSLGELPEAHISISKIDDGNPRTYQISSKGKIGQRERTVTKEFVVNWVPKGGPTPMPYLPEGVAVIVKNNVSLGGASLVDEDGNPLGGGVGITGDVYLDKEANSFEFGNSGNFFDGDIYTVEERKGDILDDQRVDKENIEVKSSGLEFDWGKLDEFFDNFPVAPVLNLHEDISVEGNSEGVELDIVKDGKLTITTDPLMNNYTLDLDDDYSFTRGEISGTLNIDLGNEDRVLVFDELIFSWGQLKIIGTGNLTIYVKNTFNTAGEFINDQGIEKLTMIYSGSNLLNLSTININANFLIKQADVSIGHGGGSTGLIVSGGKSVDIFGGITMDAIIVAPYASVTLRNEGGTMSGVVIADELVMHGGPKLQYKKVDTSKFPFDFITVPNVPTQPGAGDTGGLLTPKPNTE
mgnify:CR=1 FL=1